MTAQNRTIQSVETAFDIIDSLVELEGGGVTEIANRLGIAPSTVSNHLQTMREKGYVINEGGHYYPSGEFLLVGEFVRRRKSGFVKSRQIVESLATETGLRVHFAVEELGVGRYLYTSTGASAVETFPGTGNSFPLHVTAAGKAILASLPDAKADTIIRSLNFKKMTEHSISNQDELGDELDKVRDQDIATNEQEHKKGISAIATAVKEPSGNLLGAITVSGPSKRLDGHLVDGALEEELLGAANKLELELKYSG